jgi:hypothetical protein
MAPRKQRDTNAGDRTDMMGVNRYSDDGRVQRDDGRPASRERSIGFARGGV